MTYVGAVRVAPRPGSGGRLAVRRAAAAGAAPGARARPGRRRRAADRAAPVGPAPAAPARPARGVGAGPRAAAPRPRRLDRRPRVLGAERAAARRHARRADRRRHARRRSSPATTTTSPRCARGRPATCTTGRPAPAPPRPRLGRHRPAARARRGWTDLTHRRTVLRVAGTRRRAHRHRRRPPAPRPLRPGAPARSTGLGLGVTHTPQRRLLRAFADDGHALVLAGHTHGGQLRLPGLGPAVTNCDLERARARGLSPLGPRTAAAAGCTSAPGWAPARTCRCGSAAGRRPRC